VDKIDSGKFKKFDILDCITNAEHARNCLYADAAYAVEDGDTAPEESVDSLWEDIKRASDRHGFAITPALQDAYAWTRARAAARDISAINTMFDSLSAKTAATPKPAIA